MTRRNSKRQFVVISSEVGDRPIVISSEARRAESRNLFLEILSDHRNFRQRQVLLHDVGEEEADQDHIDEDGRPEAKKLVGVGDANEKHGRQERVDKHVLDGIVDRIVLLTDEIGQQHRHTVAGETAPGAGHVAVFRDQENVDADEDGAADAGEDGAPDGLVGEFVPEGQVDSVIICG